MGGISGQGLAIIVVAALTIYAAEGVVAGTKKIAHGVKHVAAKIIHPHRHKTEPKS